MKILNVGSLNIDRVYAVDHFVLGGETISARNMEVFPGGKGLNQSIALARAGATVAHAGAIGEDGLFLKELLKNNNVDVNSLLVKEGATGHAIIQVNPDGKNCIVILGGTNVSLTEEEVDKFLEGYEANDILLLQNEVNLTPYMMHKAHELGMKIAYNASPINENVFANPLDYVDIFLINENEGASLANKEGDFEEILEELVKKYPNAEIVLTLGEKGVLYAYQNIREKVNACLVDAIDTTAAGDTFCGYFLACKAKGLSIKEALHYATHASACAVMKKGAAPSIPTWDEMKAFEEKEKN